MRVCVVCVKVCVLFVVYGGNVWYDVCAGLCLCVLFLFVCVVRVINCAMVYGMFFCRVFVLVCVFLFNCVCVVRVLY